MSLLIDCYNLLHTPMPQPLAGLDEARLCRLLAVSRWSRHDICVVCDGGPKPGVPESSPVESVDLCYAGRGRTADEVILERIASHTAPRRLAVVSNDRAIQRAARRRRAQVVTCEQLIGDLAAAAARQPPATERPAALPADTDYWLDQFNVDGDQPVDKPPRPRRRPRS